MNGGEAACIQQQGLRTITDLIENRAPKYTRLDNGERINTAHHQEGKFVFEKCRHFDSLSQMLSSKKRQNARWVRKN